MSFLDNWVVRENLQVVGIYQTRYAAMTAALALVSGEFTVKELGDIGYDIFYFDTNIIQIRRQQK